MPKQHVVVQGECLSSIARDFGFSSFRALYDDPLNEELRKKRPNPNVLFPGDVVMIPDKGANVADLATGQKHRIVVKRSEVPRLRVRTLAADGTVLAGRPFSLELGGQTIDGTTDDDGLVDEPVPAGVKTATLTIDVDDEDPPNQVKIPLQLGALDPIDEVSGLQARLRNLGSDPGPIDGVFGDITRAAMQLFQLRNGLTVTDEIDDDTRAALVDFHEGPGLPPPRVEVASGGAADDDAAGGGAGDGSGAPMPVLGDDDEAGGAPGGEARE
jgi:N-acetylmuramoyl-L-alanine amidase